MLDFKVERQCLWRVTGFYNHPQVAIWHVCGLHRSELDVTTFLPHTAGTAEIQPFPHDICMYIADLESNHQRICAERKCIGTG